MNTLILMPVYNRAQQTLYCVNDLLSVKKDMPLVVLDDCSGEYLLPPEIDVLRSSEHIGIYKQRIKGLEYFLSTDYERLYFTDSDVLFAENFYDILGRIDSYDNIVGLYNTKYHPAQKPYDDFMNISKTIPGVSVLLRRNHAEILLDYLWKFTCQGLGWDWVLSCVFDDFLITRESHVEHLGYDGLHWQAHDRAMNPVSSLIKKLEEYEKAR